MAVGTVWSAQAHHLILFLLPAVPSFCGMLSIRDVGEVLFSKETSMLPWTLRQQQGDSIPCLICL
jgi:hypothetical protein